MDELQGGSDLPGEELESDLGGLDLDDESGLGDALADEGPGPGLEDEGLGGLEDEGDTYGECLESVQRIASMLTDDPDIFRS
jgi:hypothetical protein